jgi:serine/threonine protein kinase
MKFESLQALKTHSLQVINRLFSMKQVPLCGNNKAVLLIFYICSIVMEYADDGDVFQRICESQKQKMYMKEKHIWQILIQVVKGLKALHDMRILHRDMKSANIFLYKDGTAKLGDLNVSKVAKKGLLYT